MEKRKLITVLKTLSDSEFKEFGKYLEGTSYRKEGYVFALYKYLKKYHPEYPSAKVDKDYVQKRKKLKRIKIAKNKISKDFKEEIKSESQFINKYWLLQKTEELEA